MTTSSTKMHWYGIPQPIWPLVGSKTLTATTKLGVILLNESQQWFWVSNYGIRTIKMGFNQIWMFVTFRYRGLHHLDLYCTLIIEVWLKLNIQFDCRYLELWNACIIGLVFIALNVRDGTESKYPSIVFLSISWKMEHLLFWSKCSFFHNVFKSIQDLT